MKFKPLPIKDFPKPLPILKIIGPSFIILGLGLGSGELILWPYLSSKYGLGIIWGTIVGITFQFFMNMEIERYALARGESIFVGFARKLKILPYWFVLSTFIPWIWPGIAASSAQIFGHIIGYNKTTPITIALLILIGLILSLGSTLYKTMERLQKTIIIIGVPFIFGITIFLAQKAHWIALAKGSIGIGEGFFGLPAGISIATFLGALAYAGAGGNLNLAQSFYVKEKGYGMGVYAEKIRGILFGNKKTITVTGNQFEPTESNLKDFKKWWKNINIEHALIFWLTGMLTMLLLGLLSYTTLYGTSGQTEGIGFLFLEADRIKMMLFPLAGVFFLAVVSLTLFSTQIGIMDATSRIITENLILSSEKLEGKSVSKMYYIVLWLQILAGVVILLCGFTQPMQLIVLAAVLNAFTMFVHSGLTLWVNMTLLGKKLRPSLFRFMVMFSAFAFYGSFSVYIIIQML